MNCEDFRQNLLAAPDDMSDAMASHMEACEPCQGVASQMLAMDTVLREAMQVEVPQNLGQTVLMQKILRSKRRFNIPLFAVAATVLLGLGFATGSYLGRASTSELTDALIAHVEHEPILLQPSTEVVELQRVSNVLLQANVTLRADIGRVRHAGLCEFNGKTVPHLVVTTQNGPVTVMLLPDETVDSVQSFDNGVFSGVIVPNGRGAIAIIGGDSSDIELVRQQFNQAVEFSI